MNTHQQKTFSISKSIRGITVVELMVAMSIGLVIAAGILQVFISNKKTYRVQEALSRIQENGRYAIQFITQDIRLADFWGCQGNITNVNNDLDSGHADFIDFASGGVMGTNDDGLNNSDSITLRGGFGNGITIEAPYMVVASSALQISTGNGLAQGDIVMVSDCSTADVFQVSNSNPNTAGTISHNTGTASGTPGNATGNLSKTYSGDATLFSMQDYTYSIQAGASGEPALFRSDIAGNDREMVEGVENMQITYGEDTDGDNTANRYVDADDAALDMENVVSVRVVLTVRSIEERVTSNVTDSGDYRLRRVFSTTVALRNRVI